MLSEENKYILILAHLSGLVNELAVLLVSLENTFSSVLLVMDLLTVVGEAGGVVSDDVSPLKQDS